MEVTTYIASLGKLQDKLNQLDYSNVVNIIPGNYPSGEQYFVIVANIEMLKEIKVGDSLATLMANIHLDRDEVLKVLRTLEYTDGKAVLATNSDGNHLITAQKTSSGLMIMLYNEFMPIFTENGYGNMDAGWCSKDTVEGQEFTFVDTDGTVSLGDYLALFGVDNPNLTVSAVSQSGWNKILLGADQE